MASRTYIRNDNVSIQMVTLDDLRQAVRDVLLETLKELGHIDKEPQSVEVTALLKRQWLNEQEVYTCFGIPIKTLQKMRHRRTGPQFTKIGKKSIRYRPQDVQDFIESGMQKTIDQD